VSCFEVMLASISAAYCAFCLLPKTVKKKIYKTVVFAFVLLRCESSTVSLGEEKSVCLENRLLKNILLDLRGRRRWEAG